MCAPLPISLLTAKATDGNGLIATSAPVSVTVTGSGQPPSVSLVSPSNGATLTAPGKITLTANASSTGSTIAKVDFYNGNTLLGTATTAPYNFTWNNIAAGTYSLTAKATDAQGIATTSVPVSVTVNAASAQIYYIHTDQLDTPRLITDTQGNVVWQWDNVDPFGNNVPNENPAGLGTFTFPLRFAGQYADKETNTFYNFHRDYDPAIGAYKQFDPIGLRGGINGYAYALSNPLRYSDPYGLYSWGEFGSDASNAVVGFGDGVSSVLTLGMYSTADARKSLGINGGVNQCSASYNAGKYGGYAWGAATMWAAGLNGGSSSVLWSGAGNMERAAQLGTSLESTPIGALMNLAGEKTPYWMWKAASATFAANADGAAIKIGVEAGNIWRTIEQPILNARSIPITRVSWILCKRVFLALRHSVLELDIKPV